MYFYFSIDKIGGMTVHIIYIRDPYKAIFQQLYNIIPFSINPDIDITRLPNLWLRIKPCHTLTFQYATLIPITFKHSLQHSRSLVHHFILAFYMFCYSYPFI